MSKVIFFLLAITIFNCSTNNDDSNTPSDIPDATLLGRWVLIGFEDVIRYEFTENKRITIYSVDGTFPTLEEFKQQNPDIKGNEWYYEGDKVTIDLNFGNLSTLTPEFVCGNNVLKWINDQEDTDSIYFREKYDITLCSEIN